MNQTRITDMLRKLGADLTELADALGESDPPAREEPAPTPDPDTGTGKPDSEATATAPEAKTYSFEEARGILGQYAHRGNHEREQVKALVLSHGGASISAYRDKPEVLAALVAEVEALHAD